jgi:outer membrane lipoprotein-sorting protein
MRVHVAILSLCLTLLLWSPIPVWGLSPSTTLQAVDDLRVPGDNFSFNLTITSNRAGAMPIVQKLTVYVKDATKSLVKFTEPPESRGQVLLMVGPSLWIYMPTINQPLRISPQQRLVGPVSYGDVARVVYDHDYIVQSEDTEKIDNTELIKLELKAKNQDATYGQIIIWIESDTYKPYKAQLYAFSGRMLKTAYYKGYTNVLGKDRPMELDIHDEVRKGEISIIEYSNMEIANTPESYFQKEYLKYVR